MNEKSGSETKPRARAAREPDGSGPASAVEIEDALDEMVIAYETKRAADDAARPEGIPALPALDDDGEIATGASALRDHLQSLRDLMADWHRFQSDACCVEDGGSG